MDSAARETIRKEIEDEAARLGTGSDFDSHVLRKIIPKYKEHTALALEEYGTFRSGISVQEQGDWSMTPRDDMEVSSPPCAVSKARYSTDGMPPSASQAHDSQNQDSQQSNPSRPSVAASTPTTSNSYRSAMSNASSDIPPRLMAPPTGFHANSSREQLKDNALAEFTGVWDRMALCFKNQPIWKLKSLELSKVRFAGTPNVGWKGHARKAAPDLFNVGQTYGTAEWSEGSYERHSNFDYEKPVQSTDEEVDDEEASVVSDKKWYTDEVRDLLRWGYNVKKHIGETRHRRAQRFLERYVVGERKGEVAREKMEDYASAFSFWLWKEIDSIVPVFKSLYNEIRDAVETHTIAESLKPQHLQLKVR